MNARAVVATIPLAGTAESGQADPALNRVFVNIEDPVQSVETALGAPTMALDTFSHRLYTASQKFPPADPNAPPPAPTPGRGRGPAAIPDSFHVLVFAMKS